MDVRLYVIPGLAALLALSAFACGGAASPTATPSPSPTADSRLGQVLEELDRLGERLTQLEERTGTVPETPSLLKLMENATPTPKV